MKRPLPNLPRFPIGLALWFVLLGGPTDHLHAAERLFGVDSVHGRLFYFDPITGEASTIGPLGYENVRDLSYHPEFDWLLGTDTATQQLIRIDPQTGDSVPLVSLEADHELFMAAIEFNPADRELYGLDYNSATIYRIGLEAGKLEAVRTLVAPLGTAGTLTFARDGTAFLIDTRADVLYRLRDWSAQLETVGTMSPAGHVTRLSFRADGILYGVDPSRLALLTISALSADATILPSHGISFITGIAAAPLR